MLYVPKSRVFRSLLVVQSAALQGAAIRRLAISTIELYMNSFLHYGVTVDTLHGSEPQNSVFLQAARCWRCSSDISL